MQLVLGICVALAAVVGSEAAAQCFSRFSYPSPRRDESIVDDYFGVKVKDPYRWLENQELPETKKFIQEENDITRPYIDASPVKREINERLTQLSKYPKYTTPQKSGNKYFFKSTGPQAQDVIYVQEGLRGEPKVFLDTNTISEEGNFKINKFEISDDGATLAIAVSKKGSDWITIRFKDVETGKVYPEHLEYVKFSKMAWTKDNKGIFYSRYPEEIAEPVGSTTRTPLNHKLYYHFLNTPQSEDIPVFKKPEEPQWLVAGTVSDDGQYLIVYLAKDAAFNLVYYADLSATNYKITDQMQFVPLIPELDAKYEYITNEGPMFMFRTNKNAPNFRLVAIYLQHPEETYWKDVVPEHEKDVLQYANAVDEDKLLLRYLRDVKNVLKLYSLKTGEVLQEYDLGIGFVRGFFGKKKYSEAFFRFNSFFTPATIYLLDFTKQPYKPVEFFKSEISGFNPSQYEAKQVFYTSKDGVKIPMFIASKKGLGLDGSNPVLITGPLGFGVSMQPKFILLQLAFMMYYNGIVAIPNVRGGGEYGENWHKAGSILNKQNSFDDFQAAAEYLIAEKYTNPSLITIDGKWNGGLLVATSIVQRPDLFGAAIIRFGIMDMLRYQKFSIGYFWASEYGTSENQTEFLNLYRYSPLQNIRTPPDHRYEYPATLVLTNTYDELVAPAHSLKFIATLQDAVKDFRQYNPLLAGIYTEPVYGAKKSSNKMIKQYTDILAFMSQALSLKFKN